MLLAASDANGMSLLAPDKEMALGQYCQMTELSLNNLSPLKFALNATAAAVTRRRILSGGLN